MEAGSSAPQRRGVGGRAGWIAAAIVGLLLVVAGRIEPEVEGSVPEGLSSSEGAELGAAAGSTDATETLSAALDAPLDPRKQSEGPGDRLLLIGLDGWNWNRLAPLLEKGRMPHLAALRARGRAGVLRSTVVPESAMSWTTLRTGVGPGLHGTFTFLSPDTSRRSVWHLLGDLGLRSIIVAVPKASPRRPIEGVLVGGWRSEPELFTNPPELGELLLRAGYHPGLVKERDPDAFLEQMEIRTGVVERLLDRDSWSFAFVTFEYSDTAGHRFGLDAPEWTEVQLGIDAFLGRLVDRVGPETTVMLVSDHGWRTYPRRMKLRSWLHREGFERLTAGKPISGNVISISTREGAPEPSEASLMRVREELLALRDPTNGEPVVARVSRPEDRFVGPYASASGVHWIVELAPDYLAMLGDPDQRVFSKHPGDHHAAEGIYLIAGPGIDAGPGPEASVLDVAPTVLDFFGYAPPADVQGTVFWNFDRGERPLEAPTYFEAPIAPGEGDHEVELAPELEESLRLLGYIE